jgi:hypothetical protein
MTTISFTAERVAAHVEDYTETYRVYGVYLETGDPELGGESWNFTRSFEDDEGVCTVREPQRATFYDKIQELALSRSQLVCTFTSEGEKDAGCGRLEIQLNVDDSTWDQVSKVMDTVCAGKAFYARK